MTPEGPGVDASFYKRMRSSQHKKTRTARSPPEFVFCRHWPAAGETQPGPPRETGVGVQQALAAEGAQKHPARPFFFSKADLFFASADAVRT